MTRLPSRDGLPAGSPPAEGAALPSPRALVSLLRPRQWTKNLLVFAAPVFAQAIFVRESLVRSLLAFGIFCAASSSVYVVNDLLDAERDRLHPLKRLRPIASGEVGANSALALAVLLTGASLSLAFWLGAGFGVAVGSYLLLSHFYSVAGKNVVILDAMLIAAGFVLRAVGGALAIGVPSSDWFILCTLFGALFIALSKRRAETLALEHAAAGHRPVLGHYTASTLSAFTSTSMASALITYAIYVVDARAAHHGLALTVPFVVFGMFRYHHLVETAGLGDRPEEVFLLDRPLQATVIGFVLVAMAALYAPA